MVFSLMPSGRTSTNYTGMLTRSIVFSISLFIFIFTTGLTKAAIMVPNWISYDSYLGHTHIHRQYGLAKQCTSRSHFTHHDTTFNPQAGLLQEWVDEPLHCTPYPRYSDCQHGDRYFCSMWRSVGFLMSFAVVLEGMTIFAFLILIIGGKQKREAGWRFMATLIVLAGVGQA
ncbi:hypothetical protein LTR66_016405, partial [Elasticomyces elasticus]